ncbi:MAG: bifunctional metallophosphatase/5'-nucleotidase [Bacteroidales bacterium]|jgi:5'-nucleotidase|nr:bifunctional metallophosphatase/5'-nucleotidase [Bacteroidales bacterium]
MKRLLLYLLFISIAGSLPGQTERKIVILHTNDLHSRLNGFTPEAEYTPSVTGDDKTRGGFARIAAILRSERESNSGTTLTVDAGDFLMGTLFHSVEIKTGFQLRLMKQMGYDVVGLGNHEFDFGPVKIAGIINTSLSRGDIPPLLLSNAVMSPEDNGDDELEKLYDSETIHRKLVLTRDGLKIGFFSLLGKDAVDVAPLAFPVTFEKQTPFARRMVRELEREGCDLIICVSHSGLSKDKKGRWTGEDVRLAKKVRGIDVIISGHSHSRLTEPLIVKGVPVIQTGEYGQNVGRLELAWKNGKVSVTDYRLIPVDDRIAGESDVIEAIEAQQSLVTQEILTPLGINYSDKVAETEFLVECNEQGDFRSSNLGPMIADAIHSYINHHSSGGCDISMVAVGVIRDRMVPGIMTAPDVFRIMSLGSGDDEIPGYPLSRLYVTGRELKNILEILMIAHKSSPSNHCFYSGLKVKHDPDRGLLRRINSIEIIGPDGGSRAVSFSKDDNTLYSIAANSYMLEFIGIIKNMSLGLIKVVPKDESGNPLTDMKNAVIDTDKEQQGVQEGKEWLALLEYIRSMKDGDNDGVPEIDSKYSVSVKTFFEEKR